MNATKKFVWLVPLLVFASARAEELNMKDNVCGAIDWLEASNYDEETRPTSQAVIHLKKSNKLEVTEDTIGSFNAVRRIWPTTGAEIVFNVASNATVTTAIAHTWKAGDRSDAASDGLVVKRGPYDLTLVHGGRVSTGNMRDFDTNWRVEEGRVIVPPKGASDPTISYLKRVDVWTNATFVLASGTGTYLASLHGAGTVTNRDSTAQGLGFESRVERGDFSGKLTGGISLFSGIAGEQDFTGTNSDFTTQVVIRGPGCVGVAAIGKTGEKSSLGTNGSILLSTRGGSLLNLATEPQTVDKTISLRDVAPAEGCVSTIDAGAFGGITFTGEWKASINANTEPSQRLVLSGSNTTEACVVDGTFNSTAVGGSVYTTYVTKKGTGIWRFNDKAAGRTALDGIAVEEGTLQFASLADRGLESALGCAKYFRADSSAVPTAIPTLPYAISLGGGETDGLLEYVGNKGFFCTTRPAVLAGKGGFKNDTDHVIRFAGVKSVTAGDKTLVLAGTSMRSNEVADVVEEAGTIGIRKEGTGTWVLGGDVKASGPIEVKGGKLIVRKCAPGRASWYRWTVTSARTSTYTYVETSDFGLFDAEGAWVNVLARQDNYADIEPGQVALQTHYGYKSGQNRSNHWSTLCSGPKTRDYGLNIGMLQPGKSTLTAAISSGVEAYLPVLMRLPEGANEVTSYDYANVWRNGYDVGAYVLESSVDGLHWTTVTNCTEVPPAPGTGSSNWWWVYANTARLGGSTEPATHAGGLPISGVTTNTFTVLPQMGALSVAPGSSLEFEGFSPVVSTLKVDPVNGMGTLKGATFAEGGTLALEKKPQDGVTLPARFEDATDLAALNNWMVSIGGTFKPGYAIQASPDGIKVLKSGLCVIVR